MTQSEKPLFIALNGHPKSGKSTIQSILQKRFNITPIDDGAVLRRHCRELFDLTEEEVSTQEGKEKYSNIQGNYWENRKILGEYGNILESTFGDLVVPQWAIRSAYQQWDDSKSKPVGYSFGSCRRDQGRLYREHDGMVIEVVRPGVEPTGNIWDMYNQRWVTCSYTNDSANLVDLEKDFSVFFDNFLQSDKLKKAG